MLNLEIIFNNKEIKSLNKKNYDKFNFCQNTYYSLKFVVCLARNNFCFINKFSSK